MTAATLFLLALLADKPAAVRVYVFTAESASGEHTDEEKGRLDAVREMREALAKKRELAIVNDRAQADVVVEVIGREEREGAMGGFGGKTITRMGDTIIRVHVTRGQDQVDLKGVGQSTWGRAAKDAADRVMKWIVRGQSRGEHGVNRPRTTRNTRTISNDCSKSCAHNHFALARGSWATADLQAEDWIAHEAKSQMGVWLAERKRNE